MSQKKIKISQLVEVSTLLIDLQMVLLFFYFLLFFISHCGYLFVPVFSIIPSPIRFVR